MATTWTIDALFASRWLSGLVVTVAFAAGARMLRGVSSAGALAGGLVAFVLYVGAGPGAFVTLFAVFVLTWVATRIGLARKKALGTAEAHEGRDAFQVLANVGIAAACAGWSGMSGSKAFLLGCAAALAEAAADTLSSECGQVFADSARLITTWERVPSGTDGGVTVAGTLSGILAATSIAVTATSAHLVSWKGAWAVAAAGSLGMLADSVLGATLERRKLLTNNLVNLLGTMIAAALAVLCA